MLSHEFIIASYEEIKRNVEETKKELNLNMVRYSLRFGKKTIGIRDEFILDNYSVFNKGFDSYWYCFDNLENGLTYYGGKESTLSFIWDK